MVSCQFSAGIADPRRITLLFPGALGDFLCFAPSLFALRRGVAAPLTLAARPAWTALLDPTQFDIVSIDEASVAQLFGRGDLDLARRRFGSPSVIYSWTGHGAAGFADRLASLAEESAFVFPFRSFASDEHASRYYARCVSLEPAPVEIHRDEDAERWADEILRPLTPPILAVHAGSGSSEKNWPGFASAVEFWKARGGSAIELRGPAEEGRAALTGAHRVIRQSLPRVAALLRRCTFLGNDSGITHLAAACGAPGLALYPFGNVTHWRPLSERIRVLEGRRDCRDCPAGLCLHRLPVREVTDALAAMV